MRTRRKVDPLARRAALAIGAGRIALGLGVLLATRPALRSLGFSEPDGSAQTLGRLVGGRDLALGTLTIIVHDERSALRAAVLAGAGADLIDALALGYSASKEQTKSTGMTVGALSGAAAAATGVWTARRI